MPASLRGPASAGLAATLFAAALFAAALSGCGRGPSVHVAVQNDSRTPVLALEISAAGDTLRLGRLGPGTSEVLRWRVNPTRLDDGAYGARLVLADGDTAAGHIGYYSNGYVSARSLVVALSDTALALRVYEGSALSGRTSQAVFPR